MIMEVVVEETSTAKIMAAITGEVMATAVTAEEITVTEISRNVIDHLISLIKNPGVLNGIRVFYLRLHSWLHIGMPMKGLRRNDDAMKNKCRYHHHSGIKK